MGLKATLGVGYPKKQQWLIDHKTIGTVNPAHPQLEILRTT